jgi:maleylacetoacetate isomerase
MRLFTYWRSTAAWRVRIALNLKGLSCQLVPVHLVRDGGEQHRADYLALNPQGLVPALEVGGQVFTQSLAIIEYLEESYPAPPLLPPGPAARARVRSLAQLVACDLHPLNNLRVLEYLRDAVGLEQAPREDWVRHWVARGLAALEVRLAREPDTGRFCHGDEPGIADCCLVPQLYNARRFDCPLEDYPTLLRVESACAALEAFCAAAPAAQPDAPAGA